MKGHEWGIASCPPTILICSSKVGEYLGPTPQLGEAIAADVIGSIKTLADDELGKQGRQGKRLSPNEHGFKELMVVEVVEEADGW